MTGPAGVEAGGVSPPPPPAECELMFGEFEDRYRRETSEVRGLSVQMQEIIGHTELVLGELADRPLWKRAWQWIIGHTSRLELTNYRNQLKIQQTNLLLTAAIARQNRMIVEGLRLALDKLQRLEDDARFLRHTMVRIEERRERHRLRWKRFAAAMRSGVSWVRSLFHTPAAADK